VTPFYADEPGAVRLYNADCRVALAELEAESVHCACTSPPYFALRSYKDGDEPVAPVVWGGDPACHHTWGEQIPGDPRGGSGPSAKERYGGQDGEEMYARKVARGSFCRHCNAWLGCLGLEPTVDLYLDHLVECFQAVKRVLRSDGTCWVVIGDTAASGKGKCYNPGGGADSLQQRTKLKGAHPVDRGNVSVLKAQGLQPLDLCLIPSRLALALQQPHPAPCCVKQDVDRAWLAAIFDGEGTIGIRRFSSSRRDVGQQYQDGFVVYTSVTNSDTDLLDRCIDITGMGSARVKFGGAAGSVDSRGIRTRRDSYGWRLDANAAVDVIRAIYPYLITKRKQAIIAYTLDCLNKAGREARGNRTVPQELQDKRAYLKELIHRCNQREPVDLPSWVEPPREKVEPGWLVRSFIIWSKGRSFDPDGAGSVMPESVAGWRWTRHRIKVGKEWQDCPGCPKCEPDGLVLRKGSWRPTHAYDVVLMLAKTGSYYGDDVAVREVGGDGSTRWGGPKMKLDGVKTYGGESMPDGNRANRPGRTYEYSGTRNLRDVWYINPQARSEPHYSTYPDRLVETIVKAATSEAGVCGSCGAPWARITTTEYRKGYRSGHLGFAARGSTKGMCDMSQYPALDKLTDTLGWRPTCTCGCQDVRPAVVLDCFAGIGTSLLVARELGRHAVGVEISQGYCQIAAAKLAGQAEEFKRRAEEEARRERDRNLELRLELERTR